MVLWLARPCLGAWSRGDCGLRTLGSLPAVGGSLSPPSLSFDLKCPPALGPAGCSVGPGLGAKMSASRGAHADECPPQYVCHQCSCRQAESQPLTPTCLETQRPAGRSGPDSCQITAFALGPCTHEILCATSKSKVSIFPVL